MPQPQQQEVYDETGSKLLVQALLAGTEAETLAAIGGLRRHIAHTSQSSHDVKLFYAEGAEGTWMGSVMKLVHHANDRWNAASKEAKLYRERLALVEAALRRVRNILKAVSGSDTKNRLLQWDIDRVTGLAAADNDTPEDDNEAALARLYARVTADE